MPSVLFPYLLLTQLEPLFFLRLPLFPGLCPAGRFSLLTLELQRLLSLCPHRNSGKLAPGLSLGPLGSRLGGLAPCPDYPTGPCFYPHAL